MARLSGERPAELWASADAALIRTVHEAIRLSAENDAVWGAGPELDGDDPRRITWYEQAKNAAARYHACLDTLVAMKPLTPAGMAAKASVAPHLTVFHDETRATPEAALMSSIAADALRLGAAMPLQARSTDDQALLALKAPFEAAWRAEREAATVYDANEQREELCEHHEQAAAALSAISYKMEDHRATTLEGLKLKAAAISSVYPGEEVTGEEITGRSGTPPLDVRLMLQIIRDLRAMVDEPCVMVPVQAAAFECIEQAA